MTDIIDEPEKG